MTATKSVTLSPMEQAAAQLAALAGGVGDAVHVFQTFDDSDAKRQNLTRVVRGTFKKCMLELIDLNRHGAGIFVAVNQVADGQRRLAENIVSLRTLAIDADDVSYTAVREKLKAFHPSLITYRSDARWNCFFLLKPGERVERFKPAQQALAKFFGTDGSVCDPSRVFRVPGFYNCKAAKVLLRLVHCRPQLRHSIDDVLAAFGLSLPEDEDQSQRNASIVNASKKACARDYIFQDRCQPPPQISNGPKTDFERAILFAKAVPGALQGARNNKLYELGLRLREGFPALTIEQFDDILRSWNSTCSPPLNDNEVSATVKHCWEVSARKNIVGKKWTPPKTNERVEVSNTVEAEPETPAPAPTPRALPFPAGLFPAWLEEFKDEVARALEVPPDLPGICALGVLATCFQKRFVVRANFVEPLSLYLVCGLEPGARKSPVFKMFMEPVSEFEKLEAERLEPMIKDALRKQDLLLKQISSLQTAITKKKKKVLKDFSDTADLDSCYKDLDALHIPVAPLLAAGDITTETVGNVLAAQGGRLTIASPEGAFLEILRGRYSDAPAIEVCLHGHAGDALKIHRAGKDKSPVILRAPALSMLFCVQPSLIELFAQNEVLGGRGLLSRIVFALPTSTLGSRTHDAAPVSNNVAAEYSSQIAAFLRTPERWDSVGREIESEILDCEAAVLAAHTKFNQQIEPDLIPGGRLRESTGYLSGFAGKAGGLALRVAGLLALADGRQVVEMKDFERGRRFSEYAISHALVVTAATTINSPRERIMTAVKNIAGGMNRTMIQNQVFKNNIAAIELSRALEELVRAKRLKMDERPNKKNGKTAWFESLE